MKRLLQASLPVLLILSSLGNVFAAAFCPRGLGRECCLARNSQRERPSFKAEALTEPGLPMADMATPDMAGHCASHSEMATTAEPETTVELTAGQSGATGFAASFVPPAPAARLGVAVSIEQFDQPSQSCAHCFSHSGPYSLPLTSVSAADQQGKEIGPVSLPVSKFPLAPTVLTHKDLPRDHAPPGSTLPRYLVVNVFLI